MTDRLEVPFSTLRLNGVRGDRAAGLDADRGVRRPTLSHCALRVALGGISVYNQLVGLRSLISVRVFVSEVYEWHRHTLIALTLFGKRNIEIWLLPLKLSISKGVHRLTIF